jgi:hypothetical protein
MGSPYLNNNESIILSTHNVVINTIPAEAILTNQRLILVDSRHTQLRPQDVPFTAIETVTIGDNSAMDPVLSLSVVIKDGIRHPLGIVFTQLPRTRRTGERDEWAVKLREFGNTAQHGHGTEPADLAPPWVPGLLVEEAAGDDSVSPVTDGKYRNPPLVPRKPRTPAPGRRKMVLAGSILVIVIIIAVAGYILVPSLHGGGAAPAGTAVTPTATPLSPAPTVETAQQTPIPPVTPTSFPTTLPSVTAVPASEAQSVIPPGVWVQITYAGNFTGSVGTSGRMADVTGSGDQWYQIPAQNEIVEAAAQKADGSGNALNVIFYNNGVQVNNGTTTAPFGALDIHTDLRSTVPATPTGNITTGNQTSGA